jgi:hypothetical protein
MGAALVVGGSTSAAYKTPVGGEGCGENRLMKIYPNTRQAAYNVGCPKNEKE